MRSCTFFRRDTEEKDVMVSIETLVTYASLLSGPQTLVDVLQYVVMRRVSSDKVRLTKLAVCLHTLCHWSPPRHGRDATSLVTNILQLLQAEADRASPNKGQFGGGLHV